MQRDDLAGPLGHIGSFRMTPGHSGMQSVLLMVISEPINVSDHVTDVPCFLGMGGLENCTEEGSFSGSVTRSC